MKKTSNIIWGCVLILLGTILALNALGLTNINIFFDGWWTIFIIVPCVIALFKEKEKMPSIIGIIIGVSLLLACQEVIKFELIWKLCLPIIIIICGVKLVLTNVKEEKIEKELKVKSTKKTTKTKKEK